VSTRLLTHETLLFLRDHIRSVEQLDILLHLRASTPRALTAHEIAVELRTSESSVAARLKGLVSSGLLVEADGALRYAPARADLVAAVDAVAAAYAETKYKVIDQILAKPADNVRLFADAFRLRRPKEGDDDG
jgi:hypothetical protein